MTNPKWKNIICTRFRYNKFFDELLEDNHSIDLFGEESGCSILTLPPSWAIGQHTYTYIELEYEKRREDDVDKFLDLFLKKCEDESIPVEYYNRYNNTMYDDDYTYTEGLRIQFGDKYQDFTTVMGDEREEKVND
jgi:hypothetical protein